jgi:hypothetical protein
MLTLHRALFVGLRRGGGLGLLEGAGRTLLFGGVGVNPVRSPFNGQAYRYLSLSLFQGITIHSKDHPDDPVRCFRGKGIIPATAEVLRLHLVQVDLRKYWDDMVQRSPHFCRSICASAISFPFFFPLFLAIFVN